MRNTVTLALAVALLTTTGCARRIIDRDPLPPPGSVEPAPPPFDPGVGIGVDPDGDLIALPQSQADLIARAGSDTVYFGTDEYLLDPSARATLAAQAIWMNQNPNVRASLEGHADERGTREYNLALGERRANAAREFLISQGVSPARLVVISWGKERPVADGSFEAAWAQNRRAVTVIVR